MRIDGRMAAALAKTYCHKVSAVRPLPDGSEETVCTGAPCALSRSAHLTAPAPPDEDGSLPESSYALALYTRPALRFHLGDRLEIDDGERVWHARASESFAYPSHCVTVVRVLEAVERTENVASGQDSRETDAENGTADKTDTENTVESETADIENGQDSCESNWETQTENTSASDTDGQNSRETDASATVESGGEEDV
jgi:hypothetical protein